MRRRRPRLLLLDNTVDANAVCTPQLIRAAAELAETTVVKTAQEALAAIRADRPDGILLSGSRHTLSEGVPEEVVRENALLMRQGVPVFGVCFGMQVMALVQGGTLRRLSSMCSGRHLVRARPSALFGRGGVLSTYHAHVDVVEAPPPGFLQTAHFVGRVGAGEGAGAVLAFECPRRRLYGVQFHPEADPALARFLLGRFLLMCAPPRGSLAAPRALALVVAALAGLAALACVSATRVARDRA